MFSFFRVKPIFVVLFIVFDLLVFFSAVAGDRYIFDEVYYLPASVDTLHGLASNIEHPPLVKLVLAGSIGVLGDNWLAWRLPIIFSAVACVGLVYLISRRFGLGERLSTLAAGLCCLSPIFVLMGCTAMLDMPTLMFCLLGFWLVLRGNFVFGGLSFGLGFLCKELALIMFLVAGVYMLYRKVAWRKLVLFGGVFFAVSFFGVWLYDLLFTPIAGAVVVSNPLEHFWLMVVWQLNLNGVRAPDVSAWYPPLSWVSPFGENAFNPLRWLWGMDAAGNYLFNFRGQTSIVVEYLMFPLLALLPVMFWLKRKAVALVSWLWIAATFLPWLLAGVFVRMEGNFYVVYSVPFLAVGCCYLYSMIHSRRLRYALALCQVAVGVAWFLMFFPIPIFY